MTAIVAPVPADRANAPSAGTQLLAQLSHGRIDPVPVSLGYRIGLLLVAVVMILLPVIYVGLIVLAAYGVYLHATGGTALFEGRRGGGRGALLLYLGPLVIGVVLVLFMIKPLFARRPRSAEGTALDRTREPLLFQFVDQLCDLVGASRPRAIKVDCQVNASASFDGGLFSILGRRLVLTIGLPLAAGLNLRQLTGVLAHEFGHFAQGAAMRVSVIIRSINGWFARVVYERDSWDETLEQWAAEVGGGISLVLYLAKFMVWVTRRILWVLMMVGHGVSCFLLRQMEFDADRYEARVAGSDVFAQTCRLLPQLSIASNGAIADLQQTWRERKLCDDMPALVLQNARQMPAEVREKVEQLVAGRKTGWFDTHPADRDRIASAARENCKGVFASDLPASALFSDFGKVCREASMAFYREQLGAAAASASLISTENLERAQTGELESFKSMRRMFQGHVTVARPLQFPYREAATPLPTGDDAALAERVMAARSEMNDTLVGFDEFVKTVEAADARLVDALKARAAAVATGSSGGGYNSTIASAQADLQAADGPFVALETLGSDRFAAALALAKHEQFAVQLTDEDGAEVKRAEMALNALAWFAHAYPALLALRNELIPFATLLGKLQPTGNDEKLVGAVRAASLRVAEQLQATKAAFGEALYPFEHATPDMRLGDFIVEATPAGDNIGGVYEETGAALDRAYRVYFRALSQVSAAVERIEAVMGLPPAADPPEKKEEELVTEE